MLMRAPGHHVSICSTNHAECTLDGRLYAHGLTYDGFDSTLFAIFLS